MTLGAFLTGAFAGGSGVKTFETAEDLVAGNVKPGALAYVKATSTLYLRRDTGLFKIATINTSPIITSGPEASYRMAPNEQIIITLAAEDPEGLPVSWSFQTDAAFDAFAAVSQNKEQFTLSQIGSPANLSKGNVTFVASDGASFATAATELTFAMAFRPDVATLSPVGAPVSVTREVTYFDISPDGRAMVVTDTKGNTLTQYDMGSNPFNIATGNANRTQIGTFAELGFSEIWSIQYVDNGNRALIANYGGPQSHGLTMLALAAPYDLNGYVIEAAIGLSNGYTVGATLCAAMSADGRHIYVGTSNTATIIRQLDLSTPFDITTYQEVGQFDVSGALPNVRSLTIPEDGTFLIAGNFSGGKIDLPMSTPFDISTAAMGSAYIHESAGPMVFFPGGKAFGAKSYATALQEFSFSEKP